MSRLSLDPNVYSPLDLLRVIRKGPVVKAAVDDAIDQCAEVFNLRDSIEEARIRGSASSLFARECFTYRSQGLQNLRRYFELIVFQAYLQSTEPDTLQTYQTFEAFVKSLPGKIQVSGVRCLVCLWM